MLKAEDLKVMAYDSMETAADMGFIGQLLAKSRDITSKESLRSEFFSTLSSLQLTGSILYTSLASLEEYYFSDDGEYKDKERRLMSTHREFVTQNPESDRFKTFGSGMMASGSHITLLLRDIPTDEAALGRLRDNLGLMMNAVEAIATNIERQTFKLRREAIAMHTVKVAGETMAVLQEMFKGHEQQTMSTMDELMQNTEEGLAILGLTEEQEHYFLGQLEHAMGRLLAMYSSGMEIDKKFESIIENMKTINGIL